MEKPHIAAVLYILRKMSVVKPDSSRVPPNTTELWATYLCFDNVSWLGSKIWWTLLQTHRTKKEGRKERMRLLIILDPWWHFIKPWRYNTPWWNLAPVHQISFSKNPTTVACEHVWIKFDQNFQRSFGFSNWFPSFVSLNHTRF